METGGGNSSSAQPRARRRATRSPVSITSVLGGSVARTLRMEGPLPRLRITPDKPSISDEAEEKPGGLRFASETSDNSAERDKSMQSTDSSSSRDRSSEVGCCQRPQSRTKGRNTMGFVAYMESAESCPLDDKCYEDCGYGTGCKQECRQTHGLDSDSQTESSCSLPGNAPGGIGPNPGTAGIGGGPEGGPPSPYGPAYQGGPGVQAVPGGYPGGMPGTPVMGPAPGAVVIGAGSEGGPLSPYGPAYSGGPDGYPGASQMPGSPVMGPAPGAVVIGAGFGGGPPSPYGPAYANGPDGYPGASQMPGSSVMGPAPGAVVIGAGFGGGPPSPYGPAYSGGPGGYPGASQMPGALVIGPAPGAVVIGAGSGGVPPSPYGPAYSGGPGGYSASGGPPSPYGPVGTDEPEDAGGPGVYARGLARSGAPGMGPGPGIVGIGAGPGGGSGLPLARTNCPAYTDERYKVSTCPASCPGSNDDSGKLNFYIMLLLEVFGVLIFFAICTITFWITLAYQIGKMIIELKNADRNIQVAVAIVFGLLFLAFAICYVTNGSHSGACRGSDGCRHRWFKDKSSGHGNRKPKTPTIVGFLKQIKKVFSFGGGSSSKTCTGKKDVSSCRLKSRYSDCEGRSIFITSKRYAIPTEMKQPPTIVIWLLDVLGRFMQ